MSTILQVLKRIKHLDRKIEKNQMRIKKWASFVSPEDDPPQYDTSKLIQSVNDMIVEVSKLKHSLHLLNATHKVYYKGNEMTIDELLLLRTVTIPKFIATQKLLTKKSLINVYGGKQYEEHSKIVMQYDPKKRDLKIDQLEDELLNIDNLLDEINTTQKVIV